MSLFKTEVEKETTTAPGRIATRTAAKTSPDMETTKTATATTTKTTPTATTSEQQATAFGTLTRAKRRVSRKIDTTEGIRLLQTALDEATDSSTSDMECSDDNSTIGNTTDDAVADPNGFRPPSRRPQRKRKGSTNCDSNTGRKRTGAKLVPTGGTGPQPGHRGYPEGERGPGIRTTKVVNTNVGIRIQQTTADDYRQLVQAVTALNMQFHSYQLTEDKPLKVVLRGVPEDIVEDEINKDLAPQGIRVLECKRMVVGQARRPISLVFVQLTKNDEAKGIFKITHVKKDQITQCHRCQLYGQRNCHAAVQRHAGEVCSVPGPAYGQLQRLPQIAVREEGGSSGPATQECSAQTSAATRPTKTGGPEGLGPPSGKSLHTDGGRHSQPSTSTTKPSYAAAVRKGTTKTVKTAKTVKTKTPKKGKTPSAPSLPKPSPKKPVSSRPSTKSTPAIVDRKPSWRNSYQLDAVLIGETHLRASNRLTLPNFRVYRTDREDARGRVTAILVKSTIEHHADLALDLINIEATAITVNLATGPVKVIADYKAPHRQLLEDDLSEIFDTRGAVILAGDLTARHPSWNSSHISPITAIDGPIELEAAVRQVTERVSDSVRYATNTSRAVYDRAFIPREIRDLIREKNRLRRQWQRTLNPSSKAEYNRMARRTKVALDEFRNNHWGDFMVRASETPSEFWRAVKVLKGQRVPVPPIHGARGVAFTTENKVEAFTETLERQCSPVYENVDRIGRIHRQVRDVFTAEEDGEPIRPTSPEEVKAIVKSFRPTKAPGPDGVTYRALKHAPKKFVMHMANICNAMLRLHHFPSQWKLADVAMIPKPG
ncbi:hypothetical protein Trydic_g4508 [Trypoxylus dichotomus]